MSLGNREGRTYVLLDEQDRKPRRPDLMKGRDDLPHDKSKTTRRFLAWPPVNELTRAEHRGCRPDVNDLPEFAVNGDGQLLAGPKRYSVGDVTKSS